MDLRECRCASRARFTRRDASITLKCQKADSDSTLQVTPPTHPRFPSEILRFIPLALANPSKPASTVDSYSSSSNLALCVRITVDAFAATASIPPDGTCGDSDRIGGILACAAKALAMAAARADWPEVLDALSLVRSHDQLLRNEMSHH